MRAIHSSPAVLLIALGVGVSGCGVSDATGPLAAGSASDSHAASPMVQTFRAHLSGSAEVPAVDTRTEGEAVFQLSQDGTKLTYRLNVANIDNVLMAHIHMGAADANGPIVVWLYPSSPPPQEISGRFSGVLATGTITAADLMGPLAGQSLDALVAAMKAGGTYVQVHTTAHPAGEVRGQIGSGSGF